MKTMQKLLLGLGLVFSLSPAIAEPARRNPCKPGDVYCGGECHSSRDRCPDRGRDRNRDRDRDWGRRDRDRDWGRFPRPGRCDVYTQCSPCQRSWNSPWAFRECRTVDCRGFVLNLWTENCGY